MQPASPTRSSGSDVVGPSAGQLRWLVIALAALAAPAGWAGGVGTAMLELGYRVDASQPYLSGLDPLLLYLRMPLAVLGASVLLLAPGLLLALGFGARSCSEWLLAGFALSLLVVSAAAAALQGMLGEPLIGPTFAATVAACALLAGAWLASRVRAGRVTAWPWRPGAGSSVLLWFAAVPLLFTVVLTPKIFWESFNGDGAHAHEATRLLLWRGLPFWPADIGDELASFPGMKTLLFAYPGSWFMRLFGEGEAAVRLPLVLYLPLLFAGVCAVAEAVKPVVLGRVDRALIWTGVVSFAGVMSYSATYNPYCADVGLPATQDALLLVCFLGVLLAFLRRQPGWLVVFVLLTLTTSPNGLLMVGAWGGAVVVASRSRPWGAVFGLAAAVAGGSALLWFAPDLLRLLGLPGPGYEHSGGGLVKKLRYFAPFEFERLAFVVVPAGIFPVWGLLAWRRASDAVRALWVTVALVFGLFYFMAFVSLHYFVPAMLLPLVAFFAHHRSREWRLRAPASAAAAACAALALLAASPQGTAIYTQSRELGEQIEFRGLPDYRTMQPGWADAIDLLGANAGDSRCETGLFPRDGEAWVPSRNYGGSPLSWSYYARRGGRVGGEVNYVVAPADAEAPRGAQPHAARGGVAVYVRDPERWQRHLTAVPAGSIGRSVYALPRDVMFRRREAVVDDMVVIDLVATVRALVGGEGLITAWNDAPATSPSSSTSGTSAPASSTTRVASRSGARSPGTSRRSTSRAMPGSRTSARATATSSTTSMRPSATRWTSSASCPSTPPKG